MATRTTAKKPDFSTRSPAKATADAKKKTATPIRSDEWKTDVIEAKVNEQILQEELRARHLETRGSTMALVRSLERHICSNVPADVTIVRCDDCQGRSHSTSPRCPFCGSVEEVVLTAEKAAAAPAKPAVELPAARASEPPASIEEAVQRAANDADGVPEEEGEPVKPGAIVVASGEALTAEDEVAAAASAGIQPSESDVQDLQRRVARVKELALGFVMTSWDIGAELNAINDGKLFLNARLASGAPKYRSFGTFIEGEFHNDQSWARKFMAVARTFTRDQVLAYGVSKLVLMVTIPENIREQLLAEGEVMARPVNTLREVARQLKAGNSIPTALANADAVRAPTPEPAPPPEEEESDDGEEDDDTPAATPGHVQTPAGGIAPAAPAKASSAPAKVEPAKPEHVEPLTVGEQLGAPPKPAREVTVVTVPGRFQIKMYAFKRKGALGKKRRAFTIADLPRGEFKFQNGAELRVNIQQNPTGGIYLVCEMTPPSAGG